MSLGKSFESTEISDGDMKILPIIVPKNLTQQSMDMVVELLMTGRSLPEVVSVSLKLVLILWVKNKKL